MTQQIIIDTDREGTSYRFVRRSERLRSLEYNRNSQSSFDCDYVNVGQRCLCLQYRKHDRNMVCACLITVLLFLYMIFDVHYFLRIIFTIVTGKLFQKKIKLFDTTTIYGICLTQDVDLFLKHMNNARYLRELDFARFHFYDRSGLYAAISKRGGGAVQAASSVRYRRAIPIFSPYKVTTKLLYWEGKNFYIENQFITLSDNFVRAVILSKQSSTGIQASMAEIVADVDPNARLPELPKDLELWINSMEISSKKFRKQE